MLTLVTNIPAKYRIDLYRLITEMGGKVIFYDAANPMLSYCRGEINGTINYEEASKYQLIRSLVHDAPKVVVCINASLYTLICGLFCLVSPSRFVIWWAGTPQSEKNASIFRKLLRKIVFFLADDFLCYSEHAERYLVDNYKIQPNVINVLGNVTMNPSAFNQGHTRQTIREKPSSIVRLLAVGAFIKRKNYDFLLHVFSALSRQLDNSVELHLVGDGPERNHLENLVKSLGIKNVIFHGEIKGQEVVDIYLDADIFVHPASMDQWPQVVNEAMSASLPVIVSDQSGISETLFKVNHEIIVVPLIKEKFVGALAQMASNPSIRTEIGSNGRAAVQRLYERSLGIFKEYLTADESITDA